MVGFVWHPHCVAADGGSQLPLGYLKAPGHHLSLTCPAILSKKQNKEIIISRHHAIYSHSIPSSPAGCFLYGREKQINFKSFTLDIHTPVNSCRIKTQLNFRSFTLNIHSHQCHHWLLLVREKKEKKRLNFKSFTLNICPGIDLRGSEREILKHVRYWSISG